MCNLLILVSSPDFVLMRFLNMSEISLILEAVKSAVFSKGLMFYSFRTALSTAHR